MPTEFFDQLIDLLQALWATPNRWLRRLVIAAIVTPFVSMLAGMLWGPLAMLTALVPVVLAIGWATLKVDPLVVGIINQYDFGKKLTGWVILICGVELAWAFFCGIFPLENDLRVSFTALFALIAAAALAGGAAYLKMEFSWPKRLAKLLVFSATVCGVILLLVGDKPAEDKTRTRRATENILEMTQKAKDIFKLFAPQKSDAPAPPICVDAELLELKIGDAVVGKPLSMECSTHWIRIPKNTMFYISTDANGKEIHYLFSNGEKRHVTPKSQPEDRNFPTNEFRIWGDGIPTYVVLSKN